MNAKMILSILCGLFLVTACAPLVGPAAPAATSTPLTPPGYNDPFAYCSAVGTIDQPDGRYTGPKTPDAVVKGVMKASGAPADAPVEMFSKGTFWRCMDKQVYACFVGANLPCESKAHTSQEPTAEMNDFCKSNPSADFLPAAVTGHDTIYTWVCKDGKASPGKQVFQVDARGYIREIWYAITP